MARTNVSKKQIKAPYNDANLTALHTKFAEHDTALDALDAFTGGTTDHKASCRFATTVPLTLASAGLSAVDGVTPVAGNRALVKDQSAPAQNGIYIVGATAWTRATDFDTSAEATSGARVFVSEGTAGGGKWFSLTTAAPITLGSTSLTFTQEANAADLASTAAGAGASLIGLYDTPDLHTATTVEGALAEDRALINAGIGASKRTVTINDEDAAVTGATCTIPLITGALPANAIVFAHEINVVEQLVGLADVSIKVGGTDDDAIVASTDLDGLVIGRYPGTLGAHPQGYFGGETLNVILASAGGDLATLSAGQIIVTVWYFVLA